MSRQKLTISLLPATGKTLEELDILFARTPEVRERLEKQKYDRRASFGSVEGPQGRRASATSIDIDGGTKYNGAGHNEKV